MTSMLQGLSHDLAQLVDTILPSIVSITVRGDDFQAAGSGFSFGSTEHVVTNYHVIESAKGSVDIALHGGRVTQATRSRKRSHDGSSRPEVRASSSSMPFPFGRPRPNW